MKTTIPVGIFHPSIKLPDSINPSDFAFFTGSEQCWAKDIPPLYPANSLTIRHYLYDGKTPIDRGEERIKNWTRESLGGTNYRQQVILNELFEIDGNLREHINLAILTSWIGSIRSVSPDTEIIINEMNPYHLLKYTGNGIQRNGVLPLIQFMKEKIPGIKLSLGIQTIGNGLCKDVLLPALNLVLKHIKDSNFALPVHFTEIGYYHSERKQRDQVAFLDQIITKAEEYGIASLCFIYPWDGDEFQLAGQPRNTICGIWDDDWNAKYPLS